MKVNFDKTFKDCFGNEVVNDKTGKATNIAESLCMVIFNLNSMGGVPLPPDKKYALHKICQKIAGSPGEVELTTEEGTLLKEIAAESYSCGAYGQVADIIENNV
ncbi:MULTISPECIES: hypothetical protein [Bacteroidales]|uniref:Uncharacterized protein n=1 Tax=Bacteroides uniformis dnLKV2 TaxID=1235787 RepID=R9I1H3_BACUN|nr:MULTISPECIES: hypothetical protein [Bacteroidales]THG41782.1 hypothetical protein E5985_11120 [Muribaculaceae bacterium]DAI96461.1 MAG TPA: winged helix storkhead-box1 domain protein [Caudoviricetes sp.]EOS07190.1 hypothetical protein C801_02967 [Bacteroides uniformis dnLKV2]MCR1858505.1 hypothetical protein [Phocaeicola vulgatus]QQY40795.1 hypothetical protein I6I56_13135 [Phocaeicola vulgatus]